MHLLKPLQKPNHIVVGIDEVGRGCWAGPLVAAAVILDKPIFGLRDSKKLTKLQRQRMAILIENQATAYGLGWVWPEAIDIRGITMAVKRAMEAALAELRTYISAYCDEIIIDGNYNFLPAEPQVRTLVRADATVPAVSAASILAKVARDHYMATDAALVFPGYGFERHVGYGTALHQARLAELGVCKIHRKSFKPTAALLQSRP